MFLKKDLVLTATNCNKLENLRMAIEVLTGKKTRFRFMNFNTGFGIVDLEGEETNVTFDFRREDLLGFSLRENTGWNTAVFNGLAVAVINESNPNTRRNGKVKMRWVGTSHMDRTEKPLHHADVHHAAKALGMTVEEYLNS